MERQIDIDAVISALTEQRNAAMNEIARMAGMIATLQKELNDAKNPAPPVQPELDGLHPGGSTAGPT